MMLLNENDSSWVSKVKIFHFIVIFRKLGKLGNEHQFIEVLKEKLIYFSDQKWIETIQSSRRYDIYESFKYFRYKEIYISVVNIRSHQKLLARFRMGMSNIFTNKCRLLVHESFVCALCIEEEEDEIHFLLQCPVYHDL